MKYTREESLEIWRKDVLNMSDYDFNVARHAVLPVLRLADLRRGSKLYCPGCKQSGKYVLLRFNGAWRCLPCHGYAGYWRQSGLSYAYILTNELLEYFGEIDSDHLINKVEITAFTRFLELERRPTAYMLLLKFIRAIIARELSTLKLVDDGDKKIIVRTPGDTASNGDKCLTA